MLALGSCCLSHHEETASPQPLGGSYGDMIQALHKNPSLHFLFFRQFFKHSIASHQNQHLIALPIPPESCSSFLHSISIYCSYCKQGGGGGIFLFSPSPYLSLIMVKNYRNVKFTSTLKVFIFTLFYREEIEGPKGLSLGYLLLNHKAEPEFKAPSNPVQHPCSCHAT